MVRTAIVLCSWALMGMSCITVEQMTVQTLAVNCEVARGSHINSTGAGQGDAVERAGDLAGQLARSMDSTIDCGE